jgi:arylsulfatase A-like enzyme
MNRATCRAVVLLAGAFSLAGGAWAEPPRPNIVLIVTDDQSPMTWAYTGGYRAAEAFGFNGDTRVLTPAIDQLAAEGLVFTRAYVASTVCSPSRYATLTGRYAGRCTGPEYLSLHPPGTLTRTENNTELELDRPSLPRLLQANGYRTGFVGKSHVVEHTALRLPQWPTFGLLGYDQAADATDPNVIAAMQHNHAFWRKWLSAYGFDYVDGVYAANLRELFNDDLNVHNIEWTTDAALRFIDTVGDGEPFFLYYATTVPHGPAPWNMSDGLYIRGLDADPAMTGAGFLPQLYGFMPTRAAIQQAQSDAGKPADSAWVHWFDTAVAALRTKLEAEGLWDNTLFIVTSDHGSWRHGKATLHEGGLRVPLVMHWPAGISGPATYDGLVQNIDFAPTFLELAGVTPPADMEADGVSLTGVLGGSSAPLRDHLFAELGFARGIVTSDWKYIATRYTPEIDQQIASGETFPGWEGAVLDRPYLTRNSQLGHFAALHNPNYFESDQLYDLVNDPREEQLVTNNPAKLAEMRGYLTTVLNSFDNRPFGEFAQADVPGCTGTEAFVDFGGAGNAGVQQVIVGDGNTTPTTIGGRACHTPVDPATDIYVYCAIDDALAFDGSQPEVCIRVDYFDAGTGTIRVQYDALDGTRYKATAAQTLTDTNSWQTALFAITDARFANSQNGGADLRVRFPTGQPYYVSRVTAVFPPPAAPAEMTVSAAAAGCIVSTNLPVQSNLFSVRNTGGGTLDIQVAADVPWLMPTPASGSSSGQPIAIGCTVDTGALSPGEHTATLWILDSSNTLPPQSVAMTVHVVPEAAANCTLVAAPATRSYVIETGQALRSDAIGVYALSTDDSIGRLARSASWLVPRSSLVYTNAPEYVPVDYYVATLAPGDYVGSLTLTLDGCAGTSASVTVSLRVLSRVAALLDHDEDGDVDAADWLAVEACLLGPAIEIGSGVCSPAADVDADDDFDLADFSRMQACSAGPGGFPACE